MKLPWPTTLTEARAQQEVLRHLVRVEPAHGLLRTVAGVDMSNLRDNPWLYAAAVRLDVGTLAVLETAEARAAPTFPYVPGFLSFREAPVILEALAGLRQEPDLLVVDGHGLAHPRRFGIACHVGVMLDRPAIGCAKKLLVGTHEPVGPEPGERSPILHRGELLGYALRTKRQVLPVFVSPGHRVGVEEAVSLVLALTRGCRLPEPTRQAHLAANAYRKRAEAA